ncbi:F-box/LRR-repeat protein 4 [Sipha flava]|uniref:F-box/LRR-repeat protein 4 n=1 Tax=Sipha flava TaxID=143950 RepID=A0A2S2Q7R8_9HEMI|nr:F-box/LRR-repeat protein 4 [Sipha flava]
MNDEQVGFNLADLKKLCNSYIDYTRTYMDQRNTLGRIDEEPSALDYDFVFQFSSEVVDFSSQYGSDISISYTASNLIGRPSKFPNYGDFPQSYVMRSYGPWKELAPSRKCQIMPQNSGIIKSEDFIILSFATPVVPLVISIFETYTPGSIVRISGKVIDLPDKDAWRLLWEGLPQNCNGLRHSRLFAPKLNFIKERVKEICIEFNHSQLDYYTELDAVSMGGVLNYPENGELGILSIPLVTHTLSGYVYDNNEIKDQEILNEVRMPSVASYMPMSTSLDPFLKLIKNIEELESEWRNEPNIDYTLQLPNETLMYIFSFLDLKSLRLCMRVCKRFKSICSDPLFYRELNLKPYWSSFSYEMLTSLEPYCTRITKLDLSWCGITKGIKTLPFNIFLKQYGCNLIDLRLDNCGFVDDTTLIILNFFCYSIKELSLRSCTKINFSIVVSPPTFLCQLERIDFYRTNVNILFLESYLPLMIKLKHINLGSCKRIDCMDHIAYMLSKSNKQLVSVDFWKSYTLSPNGLRFLTVLKDLEEIDLGWCLALSIPGDSLVDLVKSCPKLKKIIVVSLRGMCDRDLLAFADHCPLLEQIDLVGLRAITVDACSKFLEKCENLKLMDVNFCENIKEVNVQEWRQKYPNVCIQFTTSDYTNVYHY